MMLQKSIEMSNFIENPQHHILEDDLLPTLFLSNNRYRIFFFTNLENHFLKRRKLSFYALTPHFCCINMYPPSNRCLHAIFNILLLSSLGLLHTYLSDMAKRFLFVCWKVFDLHTEIHSLNIDLM